MLTSRHEHGFSLIELTVAMALFAVVMAGVVTAISTMFNTSSHQSLGDRNRSNALSTLERFELDLHAAASPRRADGTATRDEVRDMYLTYVTRMPGATGVTQVPSGNSEWCGQSMPNARSTFCQFQDLTYAASDQLMFRADIDSTSPSAECVWYRIRAVTGERRLERRVYFGHTPCHPDQLAGVTPDDQSTLFEFPASGSGLPAVFSYALRYNPSAAGAAAAATVDPAGCSSRIELAPSTVERNFVVSATLDLNARTEVGSPARDAVESTWTTSAAMSGRQSDDYAYWTGCGL